MPRNADLIKRLLIKLIWYKTDFKDIPCTNNPPIYFSNLRLVLR